MSFEKSMELLNEALLTAKRITFTEDDRLAKLMRKYEEGGKNQLDHAQIALKDAIMERDCQFDKLRNGQDRLIAQSNELKVLKEKLNYLTKAPENPSILVEEKIKKLRDELIMCKNVFNVHFDYFPDGSIISGFLALKNDNPQESQLETFVFKSEDPDIEEKIWSKIQEATASA